MDKNKKGKMLVAINNLKIQKATYTSLFFYITNDHVKIIIYDQNVMFNVHNMRIYAYTDCTQTEGIFKDS